MLRSPFDLGLEDFNAYLVSRAGDGSFLDALGSQGASGALPPPSGAGAPASPGALPPPDGSFPLPGHKPTPPPKFGMWDDPAFLAGMTLMGGGSMADAGMTAANADYRRQRLSQMPLTEAERERLRRDRWAFSALGGRLW